MLPFALCEWLFLDKGWVLNAQLCLIADYTQFNEQEIVVCSCCCWSLVNTARAHWKACENEMRVIAPFCINEKHTHLYSHISRTLQCLYLLSLSLSFNKSVYYLLTECNVSPFKAVIITGSVMPGWLVSVLIGWRDGASWRMWKKALYSSRYSVKHQMDF